MERLQPIRWARFLRIPNFEKRNVRESTFTCTKFELDSSPTFKTQTLAANCLVPPTPDLVLRLAQLAHHAGEVLPAPVARFHQREKWRHQFYQGTEVLESRRNWRDTGPTSQPHTPPRFSRIQLELGTISHCDRVIPAVHPWMDEKLTDVSCIACRLDELRIRRRSFSGPFEHRRCCFHCRRCRLNRLVLSPLRNRTRHDTG